MLVRMEKLRIENIQRTLAGESIFSHQDVKLFDSKSYSHLAENFGASYPENKLGQRLQNLPTTTAMFTVHLVDWQAVLSMVDAGEADDEPKTTLNESEDVKISTNNADDLSKTDDAKSDASSEFVFGWGEEKAGSECSSAENDDGLELEEANTKSEENDLYDACDINSNDTGDEEATKKQKIE